MVVFVDALTENDVKVGLDELYCVGIETCVVEVEVEIGALFIVERVEEFGTPIDWIAKSELSVAFFEACAFWFCLFLSFKRVEI